jgi:DNA repair exonuclease SbcCD ATPase subunit
MNESETAILVASLSHSRVEVEALIVVIGSSAHAAEELDHHIQSSHAQLQQDMNALEGMIESLNSSATDAREKVDGARQHLSTSLEGLEHRAEEIVTQIRGEFQEAMQQLNNFGTDVEHLQQNLKSDWAHASNAQSELIGALLHNGEELKSQYDQIAHDYQTDLSSHIAQTSAAIAHGTETQRGVHEDVSSLLDETLNQQRNTLTQVGEHLAAHCSTLLTNLEHASQQSVGDLGHSVEAQIGGLRDGAQRLLGELSQTAESIRKVISDIEGTAEAVKTGVELTNVGLRDVIAILGEVIHLLENLEKDIEDILP